MSIKSWGHFSKLLKSAIVQCMQVYNHVIASIRTFSQICGGAEQHSSLCLYSAIVDYHPSRRDGLVYDDYLSSREVWHLSTAFIVEFSSASDLVHYGERHVGECFLCM